LRLFTEGGDLRGQFINALAIIVVEVPLVGTTEFLYHVLEDVDLIESACTALVLFSGLGLLTRRERVVTPAAVRGTASFPEFGLPWFEVLIDETIE